jgi:hypothetical protein
MAVNPYFVVRIENKLDGSFANTMNSIRAWLDRHKVEPVSFKAAPPGFEISFNSEDDARRFQRQFADHSRRARPPAEPRSN